MNEVYDLMKIRYLYIAQQASGQSSEEAINRGFSDIYHLIMVDEKREMQARFLILMLQNCPRCEERRKFLEDLAEEYNYGVWSS